MTVNNTTANDSELLEQYRKTIARQAEEIKRLKAEIEELKKLLGEKGQSKAAKKPVFTENYSLGKNKRKKKRRKTSTGRRHHALKQALLI